VAGLLGRLAWGIGRIVLARRLRAARPTLVFQYEGNKKSNWQREGRGYVLACDFDKWNIPMIFLPKCLVVEKLSVSLY
jgi:hypothetical protein